MTNEQINKGNCCALPHPTCYDMGIRTFLWDNGEVIGNRIAAICSAHNATVDYAFQDIKDIPGTLPEVRTKLWGTGQAVLAEKKVINTPFIVINADDYYGKEGFKAVHEYLVNGGKSCMASFVLKNTLSDNGGVTRGICKMD